MTRLTLHHTDACSLACRYCYVRRTGAFMTREVARRAVDMLAEGGGGGLSFFGGEPLLARELIYDAVEYAESLQTEKRRFHFKITTNGLLLDDDFLEFSKRHDVFTALSHDGTRVAHDLNRVFPDGTGSYDALEPVIGRLLAARPGAPVLMTVTPGTVGDYARGVGELYAKGFRYLICSLDYSAEWDSAALAELKRQYRALAGFYRRHTIAEDKFYLSPFEVKLQSRARGADYLADRCELGIKQLSVAPDGGLYPCVQFVGDKDFRIGDVFGGVDAARRDELHRQSDREKESCVSCAVKNRCNHHCGCLNRQATGRGDRVAPALCAHERILLPIADALGGELFARRSPMFIQKTYNAMYPLLSLIEERERNDEHADNA